MQLAIATIQSTGQLSIKVWLHSPIKPTKFAESFKKAGNFAAATDKKYPSLYSQLELGHNWEDVFKKVGFVC